MFKSILHAPRGCLLSRCNATSSARSRVLSRPTFRVFRPFSTASRTIPPNLHFDKKSSFAPLDNEDDDDLPLMIPEAVVKYAIPLPDRLHVSIHSLLTTPSHVGTIWLDESVWGQSPVRVDLLKQAVDYIRAKRRGRRKAVTKTISQVSGSGRKLRQQKGLGRARVGHSRPPHFRGGAKAHGPKNVTDYGHRKMNAKTKQLALTHALSQKLYEQNLVLINQLHDLPTHKTNALAKLLDNFGIAGREGATALILDRYDGSDEDEGAKAFRGMPANLHVASSNLYKIKVGNDHAANVYDILKYEKLVLTLEALRRLEQRLKR